PGRVLDHKSDGFCGGQLGGDDQVAFVFAIFVVGNNDWLTICNGIDSLMNICEFHFPSFASNWIMRSICRANRSVSKLIVSPTDASPMVVASSVSGIRKISNQCPVVCGCDTSATVSEMPLAVIEP